MDAHKLWMLRDFIGVNKVLFKIPVYQRNYDWSETNCNRLLDDIYAIIETGEKHFIGTIVHMADKSGGFALQEHVIIDGQQRLTTLMIMLKALSDVAKAKEDRCYEEIDGQFLHNKWCEEKYKIKLKPVKTDNVQFLLLLQEKIDQMDRESHIYLNYVISKERFEKWIKRGIQPNQILDALTKLEIVEIVLTKGEDDPQVIFESINSTGLELTNSDLIRNFLLMNADNQEHLYEDYWLYIEKVLKRKGSYTNLDLFFINYLMYKTSTPLNAQQLYSRFVKLFKESGYTQEEILKELKYFSDIFRTFVLGNNSYSTRINIMMKKIRMLNQATCYPFLLHVFDDYNQGVISEEVLEKTLQFILSYLLRRMVCGVPSNSLRGLFIYLYNRVFKVTSNKQKYYEAINKFLFTSLSRDVVPSSNEFLRSLQTANIYGNSALCKFLLVEIENGDSKETLLTDSLTIEHIMPQTLSSDWSHIAEDEHKTYLHTLGNLSVTGYNSELSNKSFEEKKKIIKENSKAVILNSDVLDQDTWEISKIVARAKRLATIISDQYKIVPVVDDSIEFEYLATYTLDNYADVTGKKLISFKFSDDTYYQGRYALMLMDVIKILDKMHPGKLNELARDEFSFTGTKAHISSSGEGIRSPWKVNDSAFIESNLSAKSCVRFIEKLFEEYNIDKKLFCFNVIAEGSEDDNDEEVQETAL